MLLHVLSSSNVTLFVQRTVRKSLNVSGHMASPFYILTTSTTVYQSATRIRALSLQSSDWAL